MMETPIWCPISLIKKLSEKTSEGRQLRDQSASLGADLERIREDIQNLISIPEGYEPLCAGAFGYRESERITEITSMDNIVNIVK